MRRVGSALAAVLVCAGIGFGIWAIDHDYRTQDRERDLDTAQIADLRDLLEQSLANDAVQDAQIDALEEQVRGLGGTPVVVTPSVSAPETTVPAPSVTPPVTNPAGQAPPGQQKKCVVNLLGVCV